MPSSADQSLSPFCSSCGVLYSEKSRVVTCPSALVSTTWALPAPLMPGTVLSWNGPAGTSPLYCFMPLTYNSTCEGRVAEPMNSGRGVVMRYGCNEKLVPICTPPMRVERDHEVAAVSVSPRRTERLLQLPSPCVICDKAVELSTPLPLNARNSVNALRLPVPPSLCVP